MQANRQFVVDCLIGGEGLRVAIKDSIDIAGFPTRAGSRALADAPAAARNAHVVDALLAAGCRIHGKTTLHELAYGVTGINGWAGTPINPRFPDLVPGGSSSGSAASVADGGVEASIGTDTGGSVRVPAACCGIVGFKPSFGAVSRRGVLPVRSSLDCVGPLARDVATVERVTSMIVPGFVPLNIERTIALGRVDVACEPVVASACAAALEKDGIVVRDVSLPSFKAAYDASLAVIAFETFAAYGHLIGTGLLGPDVEERLSAAKSVTPEAIDSAERVRTVFAAEVDTALGFVDALALPTMPQLPPKVREAHGSVVARMTALTRPFNLSGHPAISLPAVMHAPIGLQLVGRRGGEAALLAAARRVECLAPVPSKHSVLTKELT